MQVTTAGGVIFVLQIRLEKLTALDINWTGIPVLTHKLPLSATADGLLGLEFVRGHVLPLDFLFGRITST